MTTLLSDILNTTQLDKLIEAGYIRERFHPDDPTLRILNYAEKAQYEKHWVHETLTCRGLIVRGDEVVGRSWPKFFNYGEHPEGSLDLNDAAEVTDKADGSLGILYPAPDGWAIATRGSFTSDQAIHATALFREKYLPGWEPAEGYTYLFEIVYKDNRIVLDYGDRDDLILLGVVNIGTGEAFGPNEDPTWHGPKAQVFLASCLGEALTMTPRPNAEGLVVRLIHSGLMVKIKQDDYVRLHRLVTGLSERSVWEHLTANGNYDGLLEDIPDEFHGWVKERGDALCEQHDIIVGRAHASYHHLLDRLGDDFERRDFAAAASEDVDRALLFMLLDGKDLSPAIWKSLKPFGANPMRYISEDVA